jgi:hypothetical protein
VEYSVILANAFECVNHKISLNYMFLPIKEQEEVASEQKENTEM